jgi:DNA-binding MarR family transcriptional regulator
VTLRSKGRLYREILTEVFRFRVTLLEGAERVTAPLGLTSARWQVLSAVEDTPAPVSHVARALGLTRQTVQEMADAMAREGLVTFVDNPHHKRARLMAPTTRARTVLDQLRPRQLDFANRMSASHSLAALRTTLEVLRTSRTIIEATTRSSDA